MPSDVETTRLVSDGKQSGTTLSSLHESITARLQTREIYLMRERKGSQVNEMEKEPTAQLNMKCHFMDVRGEMHTNL
jgi:hypothetical protein